MKLRVSIAVQNRCGDATATLGPCQAGGGLPSAPDAARAHAHSRVQSPIPRTTITAPDTLSHPTPALTALQFPPPPTHPQPVSALWRRAWRGGGDGLTPCRDRTPPPSAARPYPFTPLPFPVYIHTRHSCQNLLDPTSASSAPRLRISLTRTPPPPRPILPTLSPSAPQLLPPSPTLPPPLPLLSPSLAFFSPPSPQLPASPPPHFLSPPPPPERCSPRCLSSPFRWPRPTRRPPSCPARPLCR